MRDFNETEGKHSDDIAVDAFAAEMKRKLARKRAEGYGGWYDPEKCAFAFLQMQLRHHLKKGDPVDVANFCMMLFHRRAKSVTDYKYMQLNYEVDQN